ncbi:hypothetical protein BVIR_2015 [Blastochloris viridis]|uniref:Uncharacterized protein n=1 Tax=Blastochloris viridis TaxID=1079 RepID=A0A0P0JKL9_BLAVI|nr:hypothetical protein BVIR_2015 [Blastochloris viridis]CUU42448.1 hypothetical protein BVIRIDIS_14600 [Blastochloris viridis]
MTAVIPSAAHRRGRAVAALPVLAGVTTLAPAARATASALTRSFKAPVGWRPSLT